MITALPGYHSQDRPVPAFVSGSAASKIIDAYMSQWHHRHDPLSEVSDAAEVDAGSEQQATTSALLELLPSKQRAVLLLRVIVGISAWETARAVKSTRCAVRVEQHWTPARLRILLSLGEPV